MQPFLAEGFNRAMGMLPDRTSDTRRSRDIYSSGSNLPQLPSPTTEADLGHAADLIERNIVNTLDVARRGMSYATTRDDLVVFPTAEMHINNMSMMRSQVQSIRRNLENSITHLRGLEQQLENVECRTRSLSHVGSSIDMEIDRLGLNDMSEPLTLRHMPAHHDITFAPRIGIYEREEFAPDVEVNPVSSAHQRYRRLSEMTAHYFSDAEGDEAEEL